MSDNARTGRQSLFSFLGWFGFLFAVPLLLKAAGVPALADALAKNLGLYGSAGFLLVYFYAFPLLDIMFGADRRLLPLFNGMAASFLLFAVVVPLPFMAWYAQLFAGLPIAGCGLVFLAAAVMAMLLGIALSYSRNGFSLFGQIVVVYGLPVAAVVAVAVLKLDQTLRLPAIHL